MTELMQGIKLVGIELCILVVFAATWLYTETKTSFKWIDCKSKPMQAAIISAAMIVVIATTYAVCYMSVWFWIEVMHMEPVLSVFDSSTMTI